MKSVATFSAAALLAGHANAFWRMGCHSRTGLARLDPLVEPNEVANHAHAIHGGSKFGINTEYDDLRSSECTSCEVKEDKSAYWTPSMHFIHKNGTTEVVPQVGGMLAYYLLFGDDLKAFPAGFKMLAGDTRNRNLSVPIPDPPKSDWGPEDKTQHALSQKALGFNCLNYAKEPEGSMYRHFLPDKDFLDANCAQGIRAELFFPSCWNGKDLDSKNHKDHMAYPDLVNGGTCPEGFDTRLPSLFFETIWNTYAFKDAEGQFVFANGDPTGCGYHGDFISGWDVDFLQEAVDTCLDPSGQVGDCSVFTRNNGTQPESDQQACKLEENFLDKAMKALVYDDDNCAGPADGLCGNVPIQYGPEYASELKPGASGTPTKGYTPPAITDIPAVPTLSYKSATSAVTDQYGGGISVANVNGLASGYSEVPEVGATPNAAPQEPAAVTTSSTPAPAAPAPTAPPAVPEQPEQDGSIIGHTTYTSAGMVYEVAIEEIEVYVTVEPTPAAKPKQRRHAHHMLHRRDREHGLLGRY